VGPVGPSGPAGPAGPQGEQGPKGDPGPGLSSFEALAGLACTVGAQTGAIAIDYDAVTGDAHIRCVLPVSTPAAVRINEFSTGTEGALTDEFVEVVNAGAQPLDLSGYRLVYRSAAGTSDVSLGTLPDGTILAAGGFLLFGGSAYAGAHPADRSFATSLASAGGAVGLRDPSGARLDSVAWGTATNALVEGCGRRCADDHGGAGEERPPSRRPRHERQRSRLHGGRSDAGRAELTKRLGVR
jgi:hypothetical protein